MCDWNESETERKKPHEGFEVKHFDENETHCQCERRVRRRVVAEIITLLLLLLLVFAWCLMLKMNWNWNETENETRTTKSRTAMSLARTQAYTHTHIDGIDGGRSKKHWTRTRTERLQLRHRFISSTRFRILDVFFLLLVLLRVMNPKNGIKIVSTVFFRCTLTHKRCTTEMRMVQKLNTVQSSLYVFVSATRNEQFVLCSVTISCVASESNCDKSRETEKIS